MIGVSWLAVERMSNLPAESFTSQAQPEPKRVVAAALNFSLKASKLPKVPVMTLAISPVGTPPPFGRKQSPEK